MPDIIEHKTLLLLTVEFLETEILDLHPILSCSKIIRIFSFILVVP